jgi:hypothetical protein
MLHNSYFLACISLFIGFTLGFITCAILTIGKQSDEQHNHCSGCDITSECGDCENCSHIQSSIVWKRG